MEDISLKYNVTLCFVCQNPESLELTNITTATNTNNRTYVEIINNLFADIVWIDDKLATNLCKSCGIQLNLFAEFKRLCLETNERRREHILKLSDDDHQTVKISDVTIKTETEAKPQLETVVHPLVGTSYQCPSCSEKFAKKVLLRRHEWRAHQIRSPVIKGVKRKGSLVKSKSSVAKRKFKQSTTIGRVEELNTVKADSTEETNGKLNDIETAQPDNYLEEISSDLFYVPARGEKTCRICSRTLHERASLVSHINTIHARRLLYKCTICPERFTSKAKVDRHILTHGERNEICPICGLKFLTYRDLSCHMVMHKKLKEYKCDLCEGKGFKSAARLSVHKRVVHSDRTDQKVACRKCGMSFPSKHTLATHMIRHETKNFKCHICDKDFYTNRELNGHMTSHTNVRNFKCDLCPDEFKQLQGLRKHKSRKHQIGKVAPRRQVPCEHCGKLFLAGHYLKRHERTHTGEKPYKCRLCNQRFSCRWYVRGHLKGKHEIDVEVEDFNIHSYYESSSTEKDTAD